MPPAAVAQMKKRISVGMESAMIRKIFLLSYLGVLSVWDIKEKKVPLLILLAAGELCFIVWSQKHHGIHGAGPEKHSGCCLHFCRIHSADSSKDNRKGGKRGWNGFTAAEYAYGVSACVLLFWVSILLVFAFCVVMFLSRRVHKNRRVPYLPFLLASCFIL